MPIALGILIASGQLPENCTDGFEFIGELALDGHLRPVSGTLTIAMACQQAQHRLLLPTANLDEASQLPEFEVYAASHLQQVCTFSGQFATKSCTTKINGGILTLSI